MIYWLTIIGVIAADQWSKLAIVERFALYESREVIPGLFNLVYVTNTGAAFSFLADVDSPWRHWFFLGVGTLALVGLTVTWWQMRRGSCWYSLALALIAGGAAGNMVDRIRVGAVVDFLDFYWGTYHWPAFNVADSAICVGAAIFLLVGFVADKQKSEKQIR